MDTGNRPSWRPSALIVDIERRLDRHLRSQRKRNIAVDLRSTGTAAINFLIAHDTHPPMS
jgi:hypothetical protein